MSGAEQLALASAGASPSPASGRGVGVRVAERSWDSDFLTTFFRHLAEGYAWVLLLPSARAGLALMLLTFAAPLLGFAGLLGASVSLLVARWLRAADALAPVFVFNGLLVALFLATHFESSAALYLLLTFSAALAALLSAWLAAVWWRAAALPVLSLPFVLVAWLAALAADSYPVLQTLTATVAPSESWGGAFLSSVGFIYSQPDLWLSAALFLIIAATSRTLALMALLGFVIGVGWQAVFSGGLDAAQVPLWSFNALLAAMAVGGLFVVPGWSSLWLAAAAATLSAFFAAALTQLLSPFGLSPLAMPFLLATWLCLYAAQRSGRPALVGERVLLPETTLEEVRLARARLGEPGSIGLIAPFMGEWHVSQAVDGAHTHRGIWRNALDFIVTVDGLSFRGSGRSLEDYLCFGLPIVSPCYGQVVRVVNEVADNAPGEVNLRENWGNHVLIRLHAGAFVLLAHLRQHSVSVAAGDWLSPGQAVGKCGNSGRSPQPHLHLSVVSGELPGSATLPFHLSAVLARDGVFHLWHKAQQGDDITAATAGTVRPLPPLVGQGHIYRVRRDGGSWQNRRVQLQLTLEGRYRLAAAGGASCLCEWNGAMFACYGRAGAADEFFDLWMLAAGCTPASEHAAQWLDQPPARLLPGRWHSVLLRPLLTQLHACYQRKWDETTQRWRQRGQFTFAGTHALDIQAEMCFEHGITRLQAHCGGRQWEMELVGAFQGGDAGVPEREWALAVNKNNF